jgi:hypothetical protein
MSYVKERYNVPADINRVVIVNGKRGVITKDMGNYIGVSFYDNITSEPLPCHPTWEVTYTDDFDYNPPIKKLTRSQKRYREFIDADYGYSFAEWLGISPKRKVCGTSSTRKS